MTNELEFSGDTRIRKAAIIVSSLDDHTAAQVLGEMPTALAKAVKDYLPRLDGISQQERDATLREFCESATAADARQTDMPSAAFPEPALPASSETSLAVTSDTVTSDTVTSDTGTSDTVTSDAGPSDALPHAAVESRAAFEAADTMSAPETQSLFEFLAAVDSEVLLQAVLDERPQARAVIVQQLPPERAREILDRLPASDRLLVLRLLSAINPVAPEVLADVADGLRATLRPGCQPDWPELDAADGTPSLLDVTEDDYPGSYDDVRSHDRSHDMSRMYDDQMLPHPPGDSLDAAGDEMSAASSAPDFHELLSLPPGMLAGIFGRVPASHWAVALAGATSAFRQRLTQELPAAAAADLEDELRHLGPFRLSDVELVQRNIMETLLAESEWSRR